MSAFYLDSSAAIKWYVVERGTETVRSILSPNAGNAIYMASLGGVEIVTALARRGRNGDAIRDDVLSAIREFQSDFASRWRIVPFTFAIRNDATRLGMKRFLRGYDAVHLATASHVAAARRESGLSDIVVVSADEELNVAAIAEGFSIINPNLGDMIVRGT